MLPLGKNKVPGRIKQGRGLDSAHGTCVCHLWCKVIREYSSKDFGVRSEGSEEEGHADEWARSTSARENSKCKDSEV